LTVRKSALDQALAARTAADKALADAGPAIDAAVARVAALEAERDALALDRKAADTPRAAIENPTVPAP
jgi:hypothetical protein